MTLFDELVSWENLVAAAEAARRRKPRSHALAAFEADREESIADLRRELIDGTWRPGRPYCFRVFDPKSRLISAAPYRDRVVHHALVRVLEPLWEGSFIFHSYACRKGKGTHKAIVACSGFARRYPWVLRADVRKFYPSVDHEVLRGLVRRRVRDARILALIDRVLEGGGADRAPLAWFPGDDLFTPAERATGLPIGNLTSQFFANMYLDAIDHRMTDEIGFGAYIRYMDDILVFGATKESVLSARDALDGCLAAVRLHLHAGKQNAVRAEDGIPFLGFRVFPTHRRLRTTGKVRQGRRLRALQARFAAGSCGVEHVRAVVMSLEGHARWADAYYLRKRRLRAVCFQRTG